MFLVLAARGDTYTETIMSGHGQTPEKHWRSERVRTVPRRERSGVQHCADLKPAMQEVGSTT
jgi:hypothetical protein